jgi:aspartate aminotransferase, cytoplasmic
MASPSRFADLTQDPPIEVFELTRQFNEDSHPNKVNLGVGSYKDDNGKPWVLPIVRTVEQQLANDMTLNHEYLPVLGLSEFSNAAVKLVLGNDSLAVINNMAFGVQTLSGTGALKVGFDFLARNGYKTLYVSDPTWGNHILMAKTSGFVVKKYRYYDPSTKSVDFEGLYQDIEAAPENSVMVMHGCAHNPSGIDISQDQWSQLSKLFKKKKLFPFFDVAYQGFCSGDLDKDASAIRYFVQENHELFVAQSFAKNMGLYNERCGNLTVVTSNSELIPRLKSQFTTVVRGNYSNPPAHGARVAAAILNNKALNDEWRENLRTMSTRMNNMRKLLYKKLNILSTPGNWDHILKSVGLFSFTGLNERQCNYLIKEYHIYLIRDGRINVSALTTGNIDYVANAIFDVVTNIIGDPKL